MNINYQLLMEEQIKKLNNRPKLLLHVCCGPCSTAVLETLNKYFEITIFYYNPNTYPYEEYLKRLEQIKKILDQAKEYNINIIETKYDDQEYYEYVKGLENEKEGGSRCHKCYMYRLEETARFAKENKYDYFTTTLSVSPYKNSKVLNETGETLSKKYNINYLYADFKKKDGYKRSIELSKEYNLYRQEYCGCKYSLLNSQKTIEKKTN